MVMFIEIEVSIGDSVQLGHIKVLMARRQVHNNYYELEVQEER